MGSGGSWVETGCGIRYSDVLDDVYELLKRGGVFGRAFVICGQVVRATIIICMIATINVCFEYHLSAHLFIRNECIDSIALNM